MPSLSTSRSAGIAHLRSARSKGPKRVTVRDKHAVVVIAAEVPQKRLASHRPPRDLVAFFQRVDLGGLDMATRPPHWLGYPTANG